MNNVIRTRNGQLDDIVIGDMHLEQMDANIWWLGVYGKKGRTTFYLKSSSPIDLSIIENDLQVELEEQEDEK